jgi:hypothetical protein
MRKPIALLFAAALVLGVAGMANAVTYTWTLVEGPQAANIWPNEANSGNFFEADGGLLGRVVTGATAAANASCTGLGTPLACCTGTGTGTCLGPVTNADEANACELAPSFPCAAGQPPVFLMPANSTEGPLGTGSGSECNKKITACNVSLVPPDTTGADTSIGEYSYLVIHTAQEGTIPPGKGIGFFAGSFVQEQDAYVCNDCPPIGSGHDENVTNSKCTGAGTPWTCCTGIGAGTCPADGGLSNTTIGSVIRTLETNLWLSQSTFPFGHAQVSLAAGGAGAGEASVCGNGLVYQDLITDLCSDGLAVGGNFVIPNQKTLSRTYSVTFATDGSKCHAPDCYIQNVIIPAALAQDPNAKNVQILSASSILPPDAPGTLANGSVDSLLFMYTTQLIDFDGDGVEDRLDPCPMDSTDACISDIINGGNCPAGQVFCSDFNGNLGCFEAFLCNVKGDLNGDCVSDTVDSNLMTGVADGIGGAEHWNTTVPIGPFDP